MCPSQKPKLFALRWCSTPSKPRKLLAKVLLADDSAARTLVSMLAPIVRRVAARVAPPNAREDLIQEVWTHLWSNNCRALQKWDRSGPLLHYVAVVASNLMRDRLAKRTIVTKPIEDCPDHPDKDDPARTVEVRQLAECLERAKASLSQMHRDLIAIHLLLHTCGSMGYDKFRPGFQVLYKVAELGDVCCR